MWASEGGGKILLWKICEPFRACQIFSYSFVKLISPIWKILFSVFFPICRQVVVCKGGGGEEENDWIMAIILKNFPKQQFYFRKSIYRALKKVLENSIHNSPARESRWVDRELEWRRREEKKVWSSRCLWIEWQMDLCVRLKSRKTTDSRKLFFFQSRFGEGSLKCFKKFGFGMMERIDRLLVVCGDDRIWHFSSSSIDEIIFSIFIDECCQLHKPHQVDVFLTFWTTPTTWCRSTARERASLRRNYRRVAVWKWKTSTAMETVIIKH